MSHNYLLDTYTFIAQRLAEVQPQYDDAGDNIALKQSAAGRIEALCQLESFLSDHFDAKLPRRLARQRKRC